LEERGGGGDSASSLGSICGSFELEGNILVWADGCARAVPREPIRVGFGVGHFGKRPMHPVTVALSG
jgi:hypothetical protein